MPFSSNNEGRTFGRLFTNNASNLPSDNLLIEKQNLLCVFKFAIKDLLDSALKQENLKEKEHFPLKHFFIVFEHILLHGYIGKKSFAISSSSNRKDLWPIIDLISRKSTDTHLADISTSSKEMTNIRTPLGRVRAWLRLALMQKRLADYFKILIEQKDELQELYEKGSLLLSDECSIIIHGLLVGLNALDFNLCLREETLDEPVETTIKYSLYLRQRDLSLKSSNNSHPPGAINGPIDGSDDNGSELTDTDSIDSASKEGDRTNDVLSSIRNQKSYFEELHINLKKKFDSLQKNFQTIEQTNKTLVEEVVQQKARIEQLEEEATKLTSEKELIQASYQRKMDTLMADITVERETYKQSRSGFESMYNELQKKYEDESVSKQKVETVYQSQLLQNNEFIESKKLMEKDIATKTLLNDRMKEDNDRLTENLRIEKLRNDEQEYQIKSADKENQMLRRTIEELEANIQQTDHRIQELGSDKELLNESLKKLDAEKSSLETDLSIEKDSRQRLQKALNNEKEKVASLQFDIHELSIMKKEYDSYKNEMSKKQNDSEKRFQEQEETISELALKLQGFMTREHEFREKEEGQRTSSSSWMKDEDVKQCCQCKKEFNALRRKHHCRNCGQIFCETCVSTKLVIPGSNKPVRVCDVCCVKQLEQCAVNRS